jgi:hypothetical protein
MNKAIVLFLTAAALWTTLAPAQIAQPDPPAMYGPRLGWDSGGAPAASPGPTLPTAEAYRPNEGAPSSDEFAVRMARLEAENQRMQAELQWMRERTMQASPASAPTAIPTSMEQADPVGMGPAQSSLTMPQVQGEIKRLMWTKGDFKVVPYGWLWGNAVESTERTNPGSYTLWALSRTLQPEAECIVDGRNTRLGLDVAGPQVPFLCCAQSGGKLEIDFQNTIPVGNTENRGMLLLRHAYLEVKNEDFRLLAGQTWDVISPLLPGMLMYSVGWDAGNIGYRRAQVRGERFLAFSDESLVTVQTSINQNVFSDSPTLTGATLRGEPAAWPIFEGRVAWTLGQRKGPDALPITFGVSSHIGQTEFDFLQGNGLPAPGQDNQLRNTWSLNADLRIPITQRFGFQSEFFTGENLGQFLGGIGQGIDNSAAFGYNTIHSTGGWAEFWYDVTPRFHTHFGYSIDDPNNADLHVASDRSYNQFFFTNAIYDLTKQFIVGLEVSSWKTLYMGPGLLPGDAVRFEFVAKYGF